MKNITKNIINIAAVYNLVVRSRSENIRQVKDYLELLHAKRADFVLFPEMNISGYVKDFDSISEFLEVKDEVIRKLCEISTEYPLVFSVGMPDLVDYKKCISQCVFENGKLIGRHYKTHLGPTEKEHYSVGDEVKVFKTSKFTFGQQLCFESHFPEVSSIQRSLGAEVLAFSFFSPRETPDEKLERLSTILKTRAYDNGCLVVACNSCGFSDSENIMAGLGIIIDPRGNVLASGASYDPGYVMASFDLDDLSKVQSSAMGNFNGFKRNNLYTRYYSQFAETDNKLT